MKTVTGNETVTSEDKIRKSLHELQPSAINKETLVGADRMINSTQQSKKAKPQKNVSKTTKDSSKHKNAKTKDKTVQTEQEKKIQIEVEDLTSTAGPSENYWQVLAERRQIKIEELIERNEKLKEENNTYKEENQKYKEESRIYKERCLKLEEELRIYKEMLNETRALVDVLQDMIGDDRSGINNSLEDSTL